MQSDKGQVLNSDDDDDDDDDVDDGDDGHDADDVDTQVVARADRRDALRCSSFSQGFAFASDIYSIIFFIS